MKGFVPICDRRFMADARGLSSRVGVLLIVMAFMTLLIAGFLAYAFSSMTMPLFV